MIRFLSFLFNKPYETCKSCETLKQQLAIANAEKAELTATLISILKPEVHTKEVPVTETRALLPLRQTFTRRRAALEERDRLAAQVEKTSPFIAKQDNNDNKVANLNSIDNLEQELGISEELKQEEN